MPIFAIWSMLCPPECYACIIGCSGVCSLYYLTYVKHLTNIQVEHHLPESTGEQRCHFNSVSEAETPESELLTLLTPWVQNCYIDQHNWLHFSFVD